MERCLRDLSDPVVLAAIEAIESYLRLHPSAADTEQGIAQWWLPAMGVVATPNQARQAIQCLLERGGVIAATHLPGNRAMYRGVIRLPAGKPDGTD